MACEVCAHCMSPVPRGSAAVREGWSYHKKCHKCYVCSETDLHNAEVFKGVIFCSGCARRIFQGCSTARRAKTKPRRQRERRRRERDANPDANRVIEMARLGRSSSSSERVRVDSKPVQPAAVPYASVSNECYCALDILTRAHDLMKLLYFQSAKYLMSGSAEIGTTTDVTNDLLKELNCPIPVALKCDHVPEIYTLQNPPETSTFEIESSPKHKRHKRSEDVTPCSDLRIAELGASTEIATMALRIHSGMTFKKSETRMQPISATTEASSVSVVNQCTDELGSSNSSSESEWADLVASGCLDQANKHILNRHLGSLLKLPYKLFKKNILMRSSLISVIMSSDKERESFFKRLKAFFQEDIVEHHRSGVKRLYSTINKRNTPYKLGWLESSRRIPRVGKCKHCAVSHSYRCMREQVMRSAGPTQSEMKVFKNKVKNTIVPPFLLRVIEYNNRKQAITMSAACGSERVDMRSSKGIRSV